MHRVDGALAPLRPPRLLYHNGKSVSMVVVTDRMCPCGCSRVEGAWLSVPCIFAFSCVFAEARLCLIITTNCVTAVVTTVDCFVTTQVAVHIAAAPARVLVAMYALESRICLGLVYQPSVVATHVRPRRSVATAVRMGQVLLFSQSSILRIRSAFSPSSSLFGSY